MKYKQNSFLDILIRKLAIKLKLIKGKQIVSIFSKNLIVDLDIPGISGTIFSQNYREIDHTNIYSKKLIDKEKILDLGANIGYYTLLASTESKINSKIICIEPDPRNLKLLRENINYNNLNSKIEILEAAVTGENGKSIIDISGASNLSKVLDNKIKNKKIAEVKSVSLNYIFDSYGAFDCLRMDVEGAESIIIAKNSEKFLKSMPTKSIIFMEIHPKSYIGGEKTMIKAMNNLYEYGFKKFEIVTSGTKQDKKILKRLNNLLGTKYTEGRFNRFHYSNVEFEDAKYFVNQIPKIIRYLIAEKK